MKNISKTGVLAAGLLAAVSIASPAGASLPFTQGDALAKATALDIARAVNGGEAQALVAAGTGSAVHAAPWQVCGSAAVAGVGGVIDNTADFIYGDCNNANAKLWQDTVNPGLANALSDSAILAAPWQVCGSDTVAGVGGVVSLQAGKTVYGKCSNANVTINVDEPYGENAKATISARAKADTLRKRGSLSTVSVPRADNDKAQGLVSAGSGSAIVAAPWQVCGSAAVAGVGGTIPLQSPHTQYGDCDNANAHIRQDDPLAAVSVLDNSHVTAAAWQVCGSDTVAGVGGVISLNSPNVAFGSCNNANTVID